MASVIYELWRRDDRSLVVMPGTLPIDATLVVAELTNHLEEAWTPVIATDVDGENALPLRLDNENPAFMRYSAVRRVARTVFIGSAPVKEAANRGIDDRRIKLGCVQPGEAPATFGDALRRLTNNALYLSTDGQRYWYSLQQTVTRLAADRAAMQRADDVDEEIRRRLREDRARGDFRRVHATPTVPGDVDDAPKARLAVLGPDYPIPPRRRRVRRSNSPRASSTTARAARARIATCSCSSPPTRHGSRSYATRHATILHGSPFGATRTRSTSTRCSARKPRRAGASGTRRSRGESVRRTSGSWSRHRPRRTRRFGGRSPARRDRIRRLSVLRGSSAPRKA